MNKLISTILLILISINLKSQTVNSYPKLLMIKSDTIVAINKDQLYKINKEFIKNDLNNIIIDSLYNLNSKYKILVNSLNESNTYKDSLLINKDNLLNINSSIIESKDIEINNLIKENKKQVRRKNIAIGGIFTVGIAGILGVLLK